LLLYYFLGVLSLTSKFKYFVGIVWHCQGKVDVKKKKVRYHRIENGALNYCKPDRNELNFTAVVNSHRITKLQLEMPRIVSLKQIKVLKTISWWDISEEL